VRRLLPALFVLACTPAQTRSTTADPVQAAAAVSATGRRRTPAPASPHAASPHAAWEPREGDRMEPHQPLEQPEALAPFYDALARVDDGETRLARVVHLGASAIGYDDLTSVLRERFQTRFGDGGAGLVLLQRYMYNYKHEWVELRGSGWANCFIRVRCRRDGHYGLGGVTFETEGGARTRISTRAHELGDEVARFELWYAAIRGGGKLRVRIDGGPPVVLDARADAIEDRWHAIDVEQGPHTIEVRAQGRARGYGVVLETRGPGVVWDQFSMIGVFTRGLLAWDAQHIAGQVAHRDPDLLVLSYGGNDSRRILLKRADRESYAAEYRAVIERVRAGKPGVACLIVATTDRRRSMGHDIGPEEIETLVEAQREVSRTVGCAFFDAYAAMGGAHSFERWRGENPPLAARDRIHLTHAGRELLGGWIYEAIVAGYVTHRSRADARPSSRETASSAPPER
jgi:lysophospholipase L1-like esterase